MNLRYSLKVLTLAAGVSLGFAANAHAVSINALHSDGHPNYHSAVAAVPEADSWALMAVGLGLVGLRLRRKGKNSQEQDIVK